jgi:DNA-binding beta-propeller fold protein YncE
MRLSPAALIGVIALAACQGPAREARGLAPLEEDEADVYVYAQPFPVDADLLTLSVASVAIVGQDGTTSPLAVASAELSGTARTQRLLAYGRVPIGFYTGLELRLKRATVGAGERPSDLLLADGPSVVRIPVAAGSGSAAVVWLGLRYDAREARSAPFSPAFTAEVPARPLAPLVGYCSSTGQNQLTLFDKRSGQVSGVVPTGRGPRGVAIDERTGRAYVAVSGDDAVEVFDVERAGVVGTVRLDPGDAPRDLALTPDGRLLLVLNAGSRTASFVDPLSVIERGRVQLGEEPASLVLDRAARRAYVFNARSSTVTILDLANRAVVGTAATEAEPLAGDFNRAGTRLYVIHRGSPFMSVLSVPDLALVNRVFVGLGATAVRVDRRTDLVYVASGAERRLQVYDPFSFVPLHSADLPGAVSSMVIDDVGNTLLSLVPAARSVAVVDLASLRVVTTIDVGAAPFDIAVVGERH